MRTLRSSLSGVNRWLHRRRRPVTLVGGFLLPLLLTLAFTFGHAQVAVSAPTLNVLIRVPTAPGSLSTTGKGPFDANNNPGNDSSATNEFVRTNDTVKYEFNYNVLAEAANQLTVTSTLPTGPSGSIVMEWLTVPPQCTGSGSNISANKQTLTCNLETQALGSTGSIVPEARVLGSAPNGTPLQPRVTISASNPGTASVTRSGYSDNQGQPANFNVAVSAAPIFDLQKKPVISYFSRNGGPGGTAGYFMRYHIGIALPPGKGSGTTPLITGPITFTDTLNEPGSFPNTNLTLSLGSTKASPCGLIDGADSAYYAFPYGRVGIRSGATATNSATDSGSITCSQPGGAGQPITLTINGLNSDADQIPLFDINGNTTTEKYIFSGYMEVFVPLNEVASNAQLPGSIGSERVATRNTFSPLTAPSRVGNVPNTEPGLENNKAENGAWFTIAGSSYKYFLKFPFDHLDGMLSGVHHGNVAAGQVMVMRLDSANSTPQDIPNFRQCDRVDTSRYVVSEASGIAASHPWLTTGQVHSTFKYTPTGGYSLDNSLATFEFSDEPAPVATRSGWRTNWVATPLPDGNGTSDQWLSCKDSEANWRPLSAFSKAADNTYPTITRVRVTYTVPMTSEEYRYANIGVKVKDGLAVGTVMPNWLSYAQDTYNNGNYQYGGYWEATVASITVRIDKETVPTQLSTVTPNSLVTYKLKPRNSSPIANPPASAQPVTITDTLPPNMTYAAGSANFAPTSVVVNGDGTTTVTWTFNNVVPGQPMAEINYKARVKFSAPNNSDLINTAEIGHPEDLSPAAARRSTRTLQVSAPGALSVAKSTPKPVVDPDEQIEFSLGYANLGGLNFDTTDFIDILPVNGRIGNKFTGTYVVQNAAASTPDVQFFYATNPPGQINQDPDCLSNGGQTADGTGSCVAQPTTTWTAFTGTPPANTTAIRFKGGSFPANTPARTVTLTLQPTGNAGGDRYFNQFAGRTNLSALPVVSNIVKVEVRIANLSLVKRITRINTTPITTVVNPDTTTEDSDNHEYWPANYLTGAVDGGKVKPGDDVEYTIYYMSSGNRDLSDVNICDLVPANTEFLPNAYGSGQGISWKVGTSGETFLTNSGDTDKGRYYMANEALPTTMPCSSANTNGAVTVELAKAPERMPPASDVGTPNSSYGLVRFRAKVKS
jgi:uncharacterized repeat protein (TIGR01451 family)